MDRNYKKALAEGFLSACFLIGILFVIIFGSYEFGKTDAYDEAHRTLTSRCIKYAVALDLATFSPENGELIWKNDNYENLCLQE